MASGNVQWSVLGVLLLSAIVSGGCGPDTNSGQEKPLTPEAARLALIECLEKADFAEKVKGMPDGAFILRSLSLQKTLEGMGKASIQHVVEGRVSIGGWSCHLGDRRFNSPVVVMGQRAAFLTLDGKFERDANGNWIVTNLSISHGH